MSAKADANTVSTPLYFWFFGYVGTTFYPQTELNVSQTQMLNAAQSLASTFGKQRLVLATAVDEIPGEVITGASNISAIKTYVSKLHKYASTVYGRLDFYQFNLTALPGTNSGNCLGGPYADYNCPIYNQSRLYIDELGLNGIWFDHTSQYYNNTFPGGVGNVTFNQMMQNLTEMLPTAKFVFNQTPGSKFGYVIQLPGYTWENQTYVAPSTPKMYSLTQGSFNPNSTELQQIYNYYPGHVILHFDAEGPPSIGTTPQEPMSVFASLNTSAEATVLYALLQEGTHPEFKNESYSIVVPLVGSWTYDGDLNCTLGSNLAVSCVTASPDYNGTVYNGLNSGLYARNTTGLFEKQIEKINFPMMTISSTSGAVGTSIAVKGRYFSNSTGITIDYDGLTVKTAVANSDGNFSTSFKIPSSFSGPHFISATDGPNTLAIVFDVTPKITEKPNSGQVGTSVKIKGTGFSPSSNITLFFNGHSISTSPSIIVTNSTGSFTATYIVPKMTRGTYKVYASDSIRNSTTITFTID